MGGRAAGLARALALAAVGNAGADCGDALPKPDRTLLSPAGLQLAFAPRPAPLPLGRHFALDIVLCPAPGQPTAQLLAVDAEIPAHRHGMNYRPTLQSMGGGRFVAEGLMLHMPGAWRLWFTVSPGSDAAPLRLGHDIDLR